MADINERNAQLSLSSEGNLASVFLTLHKNSWSKAFYNHAQAQGYRCNLRSLLNFENIFV